MKNLLRLEEIAEFLFSIYLFSGLGFAWWVYPLLVMTPDLSLLALTAGPRVGDAVYNLVHHKGLALALFVAGSLLGWPVLSLAGAILFGHSSLDRLLGLGLKEGDRFSHADLKLIALPVTRGGRVAAH